MKIWTTKSHLTCLEVVLAGGIDQSIAILAVSAFNSCKSSDSGIQSGFSLVYFLSDFAFTYKAGSICSYHGVFLPLDNKIVLDLGPRHLHVRISTGFYFYID